MTTTPHQLSWRGAAQKRRFATGLRCVEARLDAVATRFSGQLRRSTEATLNAGGKRLRPLLALLCARKDAPLDGPVIGVAAAVELLHMATLVHDDVLDGAALRRGRPTVVREAGVHVATSVGNYLLAAAFSEIVDTRHPEAVAVLSDVATGLSEGEILQMHEAYLVAVEPDAYVRRCTLKTGGLFAASCRLGAVVTGAPPAVARELEEYGRLLGVAFQIFDDILDFTGEEMTTGKRTGTDVRDGTMTLPLIYALAVSPGLADVLGRRQKTEADVVRVVDEVRRCGALDRAREAALGYVAAARERLAACPDDIEKDLLSQLAGRVVDRYS